MHCGNEGKRKMNNHPQELVFDKRSSTFDNLEWVKDKQFYGWIFEAIFEYEKNCNINGEKIESYLDVGTGTGQVLKYISGNYVAEQGILKNAKGIGIDVSKMMLSIAREKLCKIKNIELIHSSVEDYQSTNKFGFVICRNVFHHFDNPIEQFAKIIDLTRPGGKIYIIEGVAPTLESMELWKPILKRKDIGRNDNAYFSEKEFQRYFLEHFKVGIKDFGLFKSRMTLSNWLNNALITENDREIIIKDANRLVNNKIMQKEFGMKLLRKSPKALRDIEFIKFSSMLEISV
jgi:SAM-dependent methyltransferase